MAEKEKTIEQINELAEKLNDSVGQIEKGLSSKASTEDLQKAQESLGKIQSEIEAISMIEGKSVAEYVKETQKQTNELEKRIAELTKSGGKPESLEAKINKIVKSDEFKAALQDTKRPMEFKVATSDFTADTGATPLEQLLMPTIDKDMWKRNPIYAACNKSPIGDGVHTITYYEENTRTDSAAKVAEAGSYAASAVTYVKRVQSLYKIGHHIPVTEETMADSSLIMAEINDLLMNGVARKRETELLNGNGTNIWYGLLDDSGASKTFDATLAGMDAAIENPTYYDVLRTARLQVYNGNTASDTNKMGYLANYAFLNPSDILIMDLQKGSDGHYYIPPFTTVEGKSVAGMQVIESMDITAGNFLVGDFSKARFYVKKEISISTSDNVASDWLADTMRLKASIRGAFFVRNHEKFGFVDGTFTTALGEIEKPTA